MTAHLPYHACRNKSATKAGPVTTTQRLGKQKITSSQAPFAYRYAWLRDALLVASFVVRAIPRAISIFRIPVRSPGPYDVAVAMHALLPSRVCARARETWWITKAWAAISFSITTTASTFGPIGDTSPKWTQVSLPLQVIIGLRQFHVILRDSMLPLARHLTVYTTRKFRTDMWSADPYSHLPSVRAYLMVIACYSCQCFASRNRRWVAWSFLCPDSNLKHTASNQMYPCFVTHPDFAGLTRWLANSLRFTWMWASRKVCKVFVSHFKIQQSFHIISNAYQKMIGSFSTYVPWSCRWRRCTSGFAAWGGWLNSRISLKPYVDDGRKSPRILYRSHTYLWIFLFQCHSNTMALKRYRIAVLVAQITAWLLGPSTSMEKDSSNS